MTPTQGMMQLRPIYESFIKNPDMTNYYSAKSMRYAAVTSLDVCLILVKARKNYLQLKTNKFFAHSMHLLCEKYFTRVYAQN